MLAKMNFVGTEVEFGGRYLFSVQSAQASSPKPRASTSLSLIKNVTGFVSAKHEKKISSYFLFSKQIGRIDPPPEPTSRSPQTVNSDEQPPHIPSIDPHRQYWRLGWSAAPYFHRRAPCFKGQFLLQKKLLAKLTTNQ